VKNITEIKYHLQFDEENFPYIAEVPVPWSEMQNYNSSKNVSQWDVMQLK